MNEILEKIVAAKKESLAARKKAVPLAEVKAAALRRTDLRSLKKALRREGRINIIAEIKRASPSAGVICADLDPARTAREYTRGGAAAISVLTEEKYFLGDIGYLRQVREATGLPVLRKDFIFDPYQIYESAAFGADAVLLIAAVLGTRELAGLQELSSGLGLECLVEAHDRRELESILSTPAPLIGINSRNLRDFSVDPEGSALLAAAVPPDRCVVVESGIKRPEDIASYYRKGVRAFLIGETLMRSPDVPGTLKKLQEIPQ